MDVVFVLDISGSVRERYANAIMFVGNVTNGLDIDSGNVRVGVIAYPTSPLSQFYLRDCTRREAVIAALRFYNPGGSTDAASALDAVLNSHFTSPYGARPGARKVNRSSRLLLLASVNVRLIFRIDWRRIFTSNARRSSVCLSASRSGSRNFLRIFQRCEIGHFYQLT